MQKRKYPILEFDPTKKAVIEPSELIDEIDIPKRGVICFFQEVIQNLLEEDRLSQVAAINSEMGEHPVYELSYNDKKIAVFHPGIGAPLAAGMLEETIALGVEKFIACGGAGVLKEEIAVGKLIIPEMAIRDEGVSYHYLDPEQRTVKGNKKGIEAIERVFTRNDVDYIKGKVWTTSSFYRETPDKVALRKSEGCLAVEMEAAAFFAVAQFRGVDFGQILYGGDDVSGEIWDQRDWKGRHSIREEIFWLAVKSALEI